MGRGGQSPDPLRQLRESWSGRAALEPSEPSSVTDGARTSGRPTQPGLFMIVTILPYGALNSRFT